MSDNLKRSWLRFHLSTAMLLMALAAVALWTNLMPRWEGKIHGNIGRDEHGHITDVVGLEYEYGFPFFAVQQKEFFASGNAGGGSTVSSAANLIVDVAVWLTLFCAVALLSKAIVMTGSTKRRWFQVHLITAMTAMMTTGAVLGANVMPRPLHGFECYGWPLRVFPPDVFVANIEGGGDEHPNYVYGYRPDWTPEKRNHLIVDVFVCGVVMLVSIIAPESLIRRREGRKPPESP